MIKKVIVLMFATVLTIAPDAYAMGSKRPRVPVPAPTPTPTSTPTPTPPSKDIGAEFISPWNSTHSSIVIDAYESNSIDWDKMATDSKLAAVIHRSSIGLTVDKLYQSRKKIAKERGYLWGAYHLGRPGNTIEQAKLFLSLVGNDPETLMILDLEDTKSGKFMSLDEAEVFMNYVYEQTGKVPVVYANHVTTIELNKRFANHPLFQRAKFWYARFKSTITDFPYGIWNGYFLWQFSSEINCTKTGSCLYNVKGTSFDMDVNVYHGTKDELALDWNND